MTKSVVKGVSLEDLDARFGMTEEKKQRIASFKGNPKLAMPEPGNHETDKTIRLVWSKDDTGNPVLIREVETDSPKVQTGKMLVVAVEDYSDKGLIYDMNYSQSIHNELLRFTESRSLRREDAWGKWFRMSAEKYDNQKFGETVAYRLRFMEDLNQITPAGKKPGQSPF